MKKQNVLVLAASAMLALACGNKQETGNSDTPPSTDLTLTLEGDSTIYGLVCDGSTDTLLVFLPLSNIAANPDTLNVLAATQSHHIYGRPKVGDEVAIVRNGNDSTVADIVIDTESLQATWCYMVRPTLRQRAGITDKMREQFLRQIPDSVRDSLMAPREYGFQIKADNAARAIGLRYQQNIEENSPMEYPPVKRYTIWNLHNGRLLLTETAIDSTGQRHITHTDTAQLLLLRRDTLVLRFGDQVQGYYRKAENDSIQQR